MRFLSRFDIIELMMTPSFWIGVATVVFCDSAGVLAADASDRLR
ncbi:hypothetical protein [Enterobacter cloacae]